MWVQRDGLEEKAAPGCSLDVLATPVLSVSERASKDGWMECGREEQEARGGVMDENGPHRCAQQKRVINIKMIKQRNRLIQKLCNRRSRLPFQKLRLYTKRRISNNINHTRPLTPPLTRADTKHPGTQNATGSTIATYNVYVQCIYKVSRGPREPGGRSNRGRFPSPPYI